MGIMDTSFVRGWLIAPLIYILFSLISTSLIFIMFIINFVQSGGMAALNEYGTAFLEMLLLSIVLILAIWFFTLYVLFLFFKRSQRFPKRFILWLVIMLLLALKNFIFSPISDDIALQGMILPLLAAAIFVPYIKRSKRVKEVFVQP